MNKSEWISHKIGILIREGRPKDQAAAIAYSMWERNNHMQEGGMKTTLADMRGIQIDPTVPPIYADGTLTPEQEQFAKAPQKPVDRILYNVQTNQPKQGLPEGNYIRVDYKDKSSDYLTPAGYENFKRMSNYRVYQEEQAKRMRQNPPAYQEGGMQVDPTMPPSRYGDQKGNLYGKENMFPIWKVEKVPMPDGTDTYRQYYTDPNLPNPDYSTISSDDYMRHKTATQGIDYEPYLQAYLKKTGNREGIVVPRRQEGGGIEQEDYFKNLQNILSQYSSALQDMPMAQQGLYYQQNNPYFTTNPGEIPQQPTPSVDFGGRNAFSQPNFNPNPDLGFNQGEKYMGLGADENYKNQVSPQSLTAGQDFKERSPLPQGVHESPSNQQDPQGQQQQDWIKYNILNPYNQGMDLNTSLAYTGQQFGQGNVGAGIMGAGLSALKGAKGFLSGFASGKAQQELEKQMRDKLYNNDAGSYVRGTASQSTGDSYFQEGGDMINKYGKPMEDYTYPQNEPTPIPVNVVQQVVEAQQAEAPAEEVKNFDKASARDTWTQKTGLPWSEAKRRGYTDGSAKDNMKLLSELNDPRFKKENLRTKPFTAPVQQEPIAMKTTLPEMVIDKRKNTGYDNNVYESILAQGNHYFGSPRWKSLMDTAGVTGANVKALSEKDRREFMAAQKAADDINLLNSVREYTSSNDYKIMNDLAARGALSNKGLADYNKRMADIEKVQGIVDLQQRLRKRQEGGYQEPREGMFDENQRGSMYHEGGMHIGQELDLSDEEIHDLLSKGYKLRYK